MRTGVDLGGTKVEAVALNDGREILARRRLPGVWAKVTNGAVALGGHPSDLHRPNRGLPAKPPPEVISDPVDTTVVRPELGAWRSILGAARSWLRSHADLFEGRIAP